MSRKVHKGEELLREIGEVSDKVDRLAAIKGIIDEADHLAVLTANQWSPREQAPKALRVQLDRFFSMVSQEVPVEFQNKCMFLLPMRAKLIEGQRLVFSARMAASLWLLAEWDRSL